jgi:amino acid transporter
MPHREIPSPGRWITTVRIDRGLVRARRKTSSRRVARRWVGFMMSTHVDPCRASARMGATPSLKTASLVIPRRSSLSGSLAYGKCMTVQAYVARAGARASSNSRSLRTGAVGMVGAVTMGIVLLSPAMSLFGNSGPAFVAAGRAAPLAFVWAWLATLPTVVSYALLSRRHPESGSAAAWAARAAGPAIGRWAGGIAFLYYFTNFVLQPVTLGVFLNDLLATIGAPHGVPTFVVGAAFCCLGPGWVAYRGITPSARGALYFLAFEAMVVVALSATVLYVARARGTPLTLEGFTVAASPDGPSGLFRALVFGLFAFCGFDVISTLGEEAKRAEHLLPRATYLALSIFAVMIVGGLWALSHALSWDELKTIADAGGMPISEIARRYWGRLALLVPLTAISASLGISIAASVGASRVLFSMGRSGLAPRAFGWLHPRYRVPWNAMHVVFGLGFCAAVVGGAMVGPFWAYAWWGTASTFFAMVTYLMVNCANIVLFRHRAFDSLASFVLHVAIPGVGIAVDAYILVRSFFVEQWRQGWATGQSVIVFDVACALAAAAWAYRCRGASNENGLAGQPFRSRRPPCR